MQLSEEVKDAIRTADSKVLATDGPHGINAVPVSTVFLRSDQIWLVNYFFDKTAENLQANNRVAFTCWTGFTAAYQIKGEVLYEVSGEDFDEIKKWASEKYPDRTVSALVKIIPEEVFDVLPRAS